MIVEIVEALKTRTTAIFGDRVAAAAEFVGLEEDVHLALPAAFVIPLGDDAEPNNSENGYSQLVGDKFAVVVMLSNTADSLSKSSVAQVQPIRNALCKALLSWKPDAEHGPIEYAGSELLEVNRAHFYYQYEFSADTEFTEADTYQATENAALSDFTKVGINIDMIDPSIDGEPDGTNEAVVEIDVPQT
ncbi:MAG: phage tail terminator protein [Methylophilaceae bacterium]